METTLKRLSKKLFKEKILVAGIGFFIAVAIVNPPFLTIENLSNLTIQISLYGIAAIGMTFAIIGGEFDLSIGSMISLCGVLVAVFYPIFGLGLSLIIAVISGILLGVINGLLVAKANINAFIVTFGGMITYKGLALTFADGRPVICQSEALNYFGDMRAGGIPIMFLIFLVLLAISVYLLGYTRFGRNVYAVGGNIDVAAATGLNTWIYKFAIFAINGLAAAVIGILMTARLNTGSPVMGDDITLTVIASVVLGGTSLSGGKGNTFRTLLGVVVMMMLANAFDLLVIQPYIQKVIKGLIIIAVVAFDSYNKKKLIV